MYALSLLSVTNIHSCSFPARILKVKTKHSSTAVHSWSQSRKTWQRSKQNFWRNGCMSWWQIINTIGDVTSPWAGGRGLDELAGGFTEDSESKRKHQTTSFTLSAQEWMEYRLPRFSLAGRDPWAAKECHHWLPKKQSGCLNWMKLLCNLISEWLTLFFLSGHWLKNK